MKLLESLAVILCVLICSGLSDTSPSNDPGTSTIVEPPVTNSSTTTEEGNSTVTVNPSPEVNTTVTAEPIVTTAEANTTTEPNGTTTSAPVTTVAPGLNDDLDFVVNDNGTNCIYAKMEVTLTITYESKQGNMTTGSYTLNNQTALVDNSSNCGKNSSNQESLVVNINGANQLTFLFNSTDGRVSITSILFRATELNTLFPDADVTAMTLYSNGSFFETSSGMSYKCDANTTMDFYSAENKTSSSITFSKLQVQAFRTDDDKTFSYAKECVQDDNISDIVPIAVGCALAGLVVIVLIAYLVGRRQKRQRGYESV